MKIKSIYVASSWRNEYQPKVVADLRAAGYEVYDFRGAGDGWSPETGEGGFRWSDVDPGWQTWPNNVQKYIEGLEHPLAVSGFDRDMNALRKADACVLVMGCGFSAAAEMGWSAGSGRLTLVYVPALREPDLMVGMANLVTADFEEVLRELSQPAQMRPTTQEDIEDWFMFNGGHSTALAQAKRTQKELTELIGKLEAGDIEGAKEECADVHICNVQTMTNLGADLDLRVGEKHRINLERDWYADGEGCLHHVKGSDPREQVGQTAAAN